MLNYPWTKCWTQSPFLIPKINLNVSMSHLSATQAAFMLTAYPLSQSETTFTSYLRLCDDVAAACKATNVEKCTAKYTGAFIVCVIHTSAYSSKHLSQLIGL